MRAGFADVFIIRAILLSATQVIFKATHSDAEARYPYLINHNIY